MSLKNMPEAFTGPLVKRSIKWEQNGKELECETYIKPLSFDLAMADISGLRGDGNLAAARRIAGSICEADGSPVFTVDDVLGTANPERGPLDGNLTLALLFAIAEVNGLGKRKALQK